MLVDIYDLLMYKKDAYELYLNIIEINSKYKDIKKLGVLKYDSDRHGNYYSIKKSRTTLSPSSSEEKDLPYFKYHPFPLETGAFEKVDVPETCECCGEKSNIVYYSPFYSEKEVEVLCPKCIASGEASDKFDGEFHDSFSTDKVSDKNKTIELCCNTPGYSGWQQEYWVAHCDDYCAYLGTAGVTELKAFGALEEILDDTKWENSDKEIIQNLVKGGSAQGYLFKCLHCGKHVLHYDFD